MMHGISLPNNIRDAWPDLIGRPRNRSRSHLQTPRCENRPEQGDKRVGSGDLGRPLGASAECDGYNVGWSSMSQLFSILRSLRVEPRPRQSAIFKVLQGIFILTGALLAGLLLLIATGFDPLASLQLLVKGGVGSPLALRQTLILATPLILTGLASAISFGMILWNIGAEGQLYMGAIAASGVAIVFAGGMSKVGAIPLVLGAGALAGGLFALIAAMPRAYFETDEVTSTLMLNFIALLFMNYLVLGSNSLWRDLDRPTPFPTGEPIPEVARLPLIWGGGGRGLHAGFLVAVLIAIALWAVVRFTAWGFEVRVIGDSRKAAVYAGMNVTRKIIAVFFMSGALAGLAGAIEITGILRALEPHALSTGLGYTGVVVAALARFNLIAVVPVGIVVAAILNSGQALQTLGTPNSIVIAFQGIILLFAAAGEFFGSYRITSAQRAAVEIGGTAG